MALSVKRKFIIAIVFVLSACATAPGQKFGGLGSLSNDRGDIYLYRASAFFASGQAFTVMLDGKKVGSLYNASYLHLRMPPGNYSLSVSPGGLAQTSNIPIQLESGKASFFEYDFTTGPLANVFFIGSSIQTRGQEQALAAMKELRSVQLGPGSSTVSRMPEQIPVASNDADSDLWNAAKKGDSAEGYAVYLQQYPNGKYVALAKQRLHKFKDNTQSKVDAKEQEAWQNAEGTGTIDGYEAYKAAYANGNYTALAQGRIEKLNRKAANIARDEAFSGLQWADSDNGDDLDAKGAAQYCSRMGMGWRLPTVAELQASYNSGHSTSCGQRTCKVSSNSRLTGSWFWTRDFDISATSVVYLTNGKRGAAATHDTAANTQGYRALCVRDARTGLDDIRPSNR